MARNEALENRVREALTLFPDVEEKQMFGGTAFMVKGKLCVSVGPDRLLCRVTPGMRETALERPGCREMIHGSRVMKGYVFVAEESLKSKKDFDYWIHLALDAAEKASPSREKVKR